MLCYLEEMTYQQAADQLRWSEATTRGRLARARELLRERLARRGVTLAGLAAFGPVAAVPPATLRTAVLAARHVALGESTAVSTATIHLVKRAARSMMIARIKGVAAAALVVVATTGLAAIGRGGDGPRPSGSVRRVAPTPGAVAASAKAEGGERSRSTAGCSRRTASPRRGRASIRWRLDPAPTPPCPS